MQSEEQFDSFYHATRPALLLQTFAVTGDLPAAHSAVRDAYTAAWQQWRKVSTLDDPQDWVRPMAWRLAQRRHNARRWHRSTGRSAADRAVLDAIGALPAAGRRALVLVHVAGLTLPHAARELGTSQEAAQQLLENAVADLATALEVDPARTRERLLALMATAHATRLPRASGIRRAGTRRRQFHTVVAAAAATATALGLGAFAYQEPASPGSARSQSLPAAQPTTEEATPPRLPSADHLLDEHQIARLGTDREWRVTRTHDNTAGRGINTTCQQSRFADPDGISALVREFEARGTPKRSAVQTVEISRSARQARRAFGTTVGWYAGCQVGRLQLLGAYRAKNVGDQAQILVLRVWDKPVTTYSVAVARTGRVVTSTVGRAVGAQSARPAQVVQSLADSVAMLCATSGSPGCAKRASFTEVPPPPSGEERGVLAVADLPPIGRIDEPWVGTDVKRAARNPAATTCDRADFARSGAKRTRTRTFLIPGADLPDRFGLSQTYGTFGSAKAARRFLDQVRGRLDRCEKRNPAAEVGNARSVDGPSPRTDSALWDVETEISERGTVLFRLGFVRVGDKVAQVTFSPTGARDVSPRQFEALVVRAGDRLRELG